MRIAIYARKSTESEDRQVQSLEDQIRFLTELAQREKLIVGEIFQESKSAKEPGRRPEYDRLVADIHSGRIEGILTWSIDRLSRNQLEGGQIAYLLSSGKLSVIRTADRIYRPEDSALLMAIETGMATAYIQNLSRNVKRGMHGKFERGWQTSKAPVGYKNDAETLEIVPDPIRFDLVRQAWDMLLTENYSIQSIANSIREKGLTVGSKHGPVNLISRNTLYRMFRNRFYMGEIKLNQIRKVGKHRAMVSEDEFARAQDILRNASRQTRKRSVDFEFRGVMTCAECGCLVVGERKSKTYMRTSRTAEYVYYHCSGRRGCSKVAYREEDVLGALEEFAVRNKISQRYENWLHEWLPVAIENHFNQSTPIQDQSVETRIERLTRQLSNLALMRADGEIGKVEFEKLRAELVEQLGKLESVRLNSLQRETRLLHKVESQITILHESRKSVDSGFRREELVELARRIQPQVKFGTTIRFESSEVIQKIVAFEPQVLQSESSNSDDDLANRSIWLGFWREVLNLIDSSSTHDCD